MRDMPLSFEADAKGGFGFLHKFCRDFSQEISGGGGGGYGGGFGGGDWSKLESLLSGVSGGGVCETKRSPSSSSASTSTLSSSLAGGGSTDTAAVATFSGNPTEKWAQESSTDNSSNVDLEVFQQIPPNLEVDKCGGMDYWGDAHLLEPSGAASESESPGNEHSILRLIMGDVEDPSLGLNKLLQSPNPDLHFVGGGGGGLLAGVVDQGFVNNNNYPPSILPQNQVFNNPSFPIGGLPQHPHSHIYEDEKNQVLNHPQLLMNQVQAPNPGFFMPLQQHNNHNSNAQDLPLAPPPKRQQMMIQKPGQLQMQMQFPSTTTTTQQLHLHSYPKMVGDEMMIQQQAIVDQLLKAAELIETGNPILAQEILARLNHHLSPIGKPFYRAAFYFKEALRLLLMNHNNNNNNSSTASTTTASPFNLFFKIGAYKSFSEISPIVQFANFTCNQAVLEALEGFDMIRIVDFDIGYGGQWASFMQELALRKGGAPAIKITAFASPTTHDQLELSLTRENLIHFAQEINISFDFEIINIDCLCSPSSWPPPFRVAESEAIAVNLPVSLLSNNAMILRFIKQLAPKIVVSIDRGCDRIDLPFAHHVHQAFQSYLALLESLDAVNVNPDALQKIETFLVRPGIEKLILGRYTCLEKTQHWKAQFLSAGLSPVSFSNFTECQADWLLKRTLARGFHVEKRQSSLVLYFQRKELISASAWRC